MKKLLGICICLLLICSALISTVVFAADATNSVNLAEDIIYFLNPTAITTVGNKLFIADRIEDNMSAILCYDITDNEPILQYTYELNGYVTNLATKQDSELYAVLTDKIIEFAVGNDLEQSQSWNIANPTDVTYGAHGSGKVEYILKSNELIRNGESGNVTALTNGIGCVAVGNFVYYAYKDGNKTICKEYNGEKYNFPTQNTVNTAEKNSNITGFNAKGIFVWDGKLALFNSNNISYIAVGEASCELIELYNYANSQDDEIIDVATYNDRLYVLNDKNKIEVYAKNETNIFTLVATVGSDELDKREPSESEYTSFTLVRSKNYPTNIVFKTIGDNSIDNIQTDAKEYIVIGYDGDEQSNFYYVLVLEGDNYRFGWVKKSDDATNVYDDSKLEVINTDWSNGNVEYKAKFSSLNTVYVYYLPCSQYGSYAYMQPASNKTEITILQQFVEQTDNGDINWLYVSYKDGETTKKGFVKQDAVSEIRMHVENTKVIAIRKINTSLFSSIRVYMFDDPARMTDEYIAKYTVTAKDENGEDIIVEEEIPKLRSGQRVSVISEENGIALVRVERKDGAYGYGYVYSKQLINEHQLTTNATVGLSLLAVAIALGITLTVVFVKRLKRRNKLATTSTDE